MDGPGGLASPAVPRSPVPAPVTAPVAPARPGPVPRLAPGQPGGVRPAGFGAGAAVRFRGARSELRRQLREQKRLRAVALATVIGLVLGAPTLYFGILFATKDPAVNALDRLEVPSWAARSQEDRIISGSRWCFIDCRFRERTLVSEQDTGPTAVVYQDALREAGWARWEVEGCPLVQVDGDYTCWTRDEYTLDLWVHPPECAYDPRNQRPQVPGEEAEAPPPAEPECTGSVVEIKMQNRVADERGLPGSGGTQPTGPPPTGPPGTGPPATDPAATGSPAP